MSLWAERLEAAIDLWRRQGDLEEAAAALVALATSAANSETL